MITPSNQQYTEESKLLEKVTEWLAPQRRDGIKVIRVVDRYQKGYSDLFISAKGYFVVAELKDKTGKEDPHQERFIEEMNATGATGGICRSVKDVADLIEQAMYCSCHKEFNKLEPYVRCPYCGKYLREWG